MEQHERIKALRESTGMNRKDFCAYFGIPYRTVTEWERDNRHAPDYVIRLSTYYIQNENLDKGKRSVNDDERTESDRAGGRTGVSE